MPDFDSPSVFARMLDRDKGGHFTISPSEDRLCTTKQQYLPSSNILQTRYLHEDGVLNVLDFFPRPNNEAMDADFHAKVLKGKQKGEVVNDREERSDLKKWLVRRVECMRGEVDVNVEVFPAFSECGLICFASDQSVLKRSPFGTLKLTLRRLRTRQAYNRGGGSK